MVTRLIARVGLMYPGDPESLAIVRGAGGFSRLSQDELAQVTVTRVEAGDFCDDIPVESLPLYLERGLVEHVEVSE